VRRLCALAIALVLAACGSGHGASAASSHTPVAQFTGSVPATLSAATPAPTTTARTTATRPGRPAPRHITVHVTVLHLVDPVRHMRIEGRTVQRSFDVVIRYPLGLPGPFPLIVFGHGYAVSPTPYAPLLDAWTKAGYVVAAPIFPLENANAPGGPNERDLPNQPLDMSLVISTLLSPQSPTAARISHMVQGHEIAVAGQSDGGDTALATAYDPRVHDSRVRAAVILSGAFDPFISSFTMPAGGPPLLATQGTADTINPPWMTYAFFDPAQRPKYLLKLLGAGHLPPYTEPGLELREVEQVTLGFMNRYLKGRSPGLARFVARGSAGRGTVLIARP
jgi:fermentation-respiration switch protein FrsA (DUF1100 family)